MRRTLVLLATLLLATTLTSQAVYFYLADTSKSCFLQEVPEDTAILVKYANIDIDHLGPGLDGRPAYVEITVTDPEKQLVSRHEANAKGRIAWTSSREGEYEVCVATQNLTPRGRTFKFGLTFAAADQAVNYAEMAKQEHLSAIVVEMRKLTDRVNARKAEQEYQQRLEASFRDESESVNAMVVYWSMFQMLVVVLSTAYQVYKLRSFFTSKKIN